MNPKEREIREAIVERLRAKYPKTDNNWGLFLGGGKVDINSWVGDAFPTVLRELGEAHRYEFWREKLFK